MMTIHRLPRPARRFFFPCAGQELERELQLLQAPSQTSAADAIRTGFTFLIVIDSGLHLLFLLPPAHAAE